MSEEKQNPKKIKNTHEVIFQPDFVILELKQQKIMNKERKSLIFVLVNN